MVRLNIKKKHLYFVLGLFMTVAVVGFALAEVPNPGHDWPDLDVPDLDPPELDPFTVCTSTNSDDLGYEGCGCNPELLGSPPMNSPIELMFSPPAGKIAKFNSAGDGLTETSMYEDPSTGGLGLGTSTPMGRLDVRGDEVRIWSGSTSVNVASNEGDLYVGSDMEVDGFICLDGVCANDWGDDIIVWQTIECTDDEKDGVEEICVIAPEGDYLFCALNTVMLDDGECSVGVLDMGSEGTNWVLVANILDSATGNFATQCVAYCIEDISD